MTREDIYLAHHLVSIGIGKYASENYHNLRYTVDDASVFSDLLRQNIVDLELDTLLRDNEASLVEIRTAIDNDMLKQATKDDTLILFFSGHGGLAQIDGNQYEAYLVPYDGNDDLDISGISTSELKKALDGYKHGKKIVLLDCCYSGGANTKSVTSIRVKDGGAIKAFQNQTFAEGAFVFTACKEDEQAIEVDDLKHGLFTYYLLDEMSKERSGDDLPMTDVCDPVIKGVANYASEHKHEQTPTLKLDAKGSVSLPPMKNRSKLAPGIIKIPTVQTTSQAAATAPPIFDISDKKSKKLVNDTLELVKSANDSKLGSVAMRSALSKVLGNVKSTYDAQPTHIQSKDTLKKSVEVVEAESFQLLVFAAAVALAGDKATLDIFCREVTSLFRWQYGKSGIVAAIEIPDVVFCEIIYIFTIISVYTDDYQPTATLLDTRFIMRGREKSSIVADAYQIHYADALGGNASTVFSHVVSLFKEMRWLIDILGINDDDMETLVVQANMILTVAISNRTEVIYPMFGRYYPERIALLVDRIANEKEMRDKLAPVLSVASGEVRSTFREVFRVFIEDVNKDFFWDSVGYDRFDTENKS